MKQIDAIDSLREELLGWSDPLEQGFAERNFHEVSSLRSKVRAGIICVDDSTSKDSSEMTHVYVLILNLFVDQVAIPDFDAVVVHSQQIAVSLVVKANLVGSVGAYRIATNSFTSCYVPDNESIVILSSK